MKIKKGTVAPFDGVLISTEALALLVAKVDAIKRKGALKLAKANKDFASHLALAKKECKAKLDLEKKKAEITKKNSAKVLGLYKSALSNTSPKWYATPSFTLPFGAVLGAVV